MLLAIQPQQQPGDGHADTHRQLHHHRQQAVAAAGQIVREIFQRQGIHRGEAAGVDHPLQKQDQRQRVIPPGRALNINSRLTAARPRVLATSTDGSQSG